MVFSELSALLLKPAPLFNRLATLRKRRACKGMALIHPLQQQPEEANPLGPPLAIWDPATNPHMKKMTNCVYVRLEAKGTPFEETMVLWILSTFKR